ncbi:MAG: tetratricopeptide repeat protein, partial [bacterium]
KFHSKYTVEYNKKMQGQPLVGLFFSLSGFAKTALQYHNNLDENEKTRFRIFGDKEILGILKELNLTCSEESIRLLVAKQIPYSISRCYLVKSLSGLYWVIIFSTEGEETHYAIVDKEGNMVVKLILCLLDCIAKTKKEIAEAINESLTDVGLELDRLGQENACEVKEQGEATFYALRKDILPFAQLSREFLESKDRGKFANSEYYCAMIDERLVNFLENRFRLQITDGDREALRRTLLVSPSALIYCLHGSTAYFDQAWSDLQQRNLSDSDHIRFTEINYSRFLKDLLERLLPDLIDPEYGGLHHKIGVKAAWVTIQVRLATLQKRYLEAVAGGLYSLVQAQGNLRGGQIVSYVNPEAFADDGLACYHLGAFQEAIENYDKALNIIQNPEKKAMVWNNKGLAYCSLHKHGKAIECYDEAIALDSEEKLKESRFNKGLCLSHLERYSEAIEWYEKTLVIDPEYENVKPFLAEAKMRLSLTRGV